MKAPVLFAAASAVASLCLVSAASAAVVQTGTYRLHNHPDGNARPPLYGFKLTEVFNATGGTDVFTWDFDAPGAAMYATYNGSSLHIFGTALGGRDIGTTHANDQYLGMYTFDFTYQWGLGLAPGDDDLFVSLPTMQYNYGSIVTPWNSTILLRDGHYGNGQPDFRFGDEDNDAGHRGAPGISGWGWVFYSVGGSDWKYVADSDWLFTAQLIPTPGAAGLVALAGLFAGRRRR